MQWPIYTYVFGSFQAYTCHRTCVFVRTLTHTYAIENKTLNMLCIEEIGLYMVKKNAKYVQEFSGNVYIL